MAREAQVAADEVTLTGEEDYPACYIAKLEEEARKMREKSAAGEAASFGSVEQLFLELEAQANRDETHYICSVPNLQEEILERRNDSEDQFVGEECFEWHH